MRPVIRLCVQAVAAMASNQTVLQAVGAMASNHTVYTSSGCYGQQSDCVFKYKQCMLWPAIRLCIQAPAYASLCHCHVVGSMLGGEEVIKSKPVTNFQMSAL